MKITERGSGGKTEEQRKVWAQGLSVEEEVVSLCLQPSAGFWLQPPDWSPGEEGERQGRRVAPGLGQHGQDSQSTLC